MVSEKQAQKKDNLFYIKWVEEKHALPPEIHWKNLGVLVWSIRCSVGVPGAGKHSK